MRVKGGLRSVVDRDFPESSLLLQYMLPLDRADAPHPDVPGFKPMARSKNDPKYQEALAWIKSLSAVAPAYGVDLSAEETPPKPK
jgi:hypothetical protein